MDATKSIQNYINKMVTSVPGLKIMLLDSDTTTFVSVAMTQSQLLAKEVYLINRIGQKNRDKMKHLKCICFLRPTLESVQAMVEELRNPLYGSYHLYFTNILKKSQIERLAESDEFEVVKEVHEFYGDYLAINSDLISLNLSSIYGEAASVWEGNAFQRSVEGLVSILLSMKKKPLIRYAKNSPLAKRLGTELQYQMQQEAQLFDFRRTDTPPILLLLDRRNDPVTPLLNQWTYQAMIHELFGISKGRVEIPGAERPELKEIVLSADQDAFYKKNMFLDLGDLGANIKTYVDEFQVKTKSTTQIETIAQMKKFVEEFPEFRKLSGNVSKHVALVSELSKQVAQFNLLKVGELEQSLACVDQQQADLKSLMEIIAMPNVLPDNKIRLVMLYGLRYEKSPYYNLAPIISALQAAAVDQHKIDSIKAVLKFASSDQRQDDIFNNESILSKSKNVITRGLKGVENIYTQHVPYISQILENLIKGRLKEQTYPFVEGGTKDKPQDIIVYVIGGATYAESKVVTQMASATPSVRIILAGTTIHNSSSFIKEITNGAVNWK
ncbi:hypothetical protein MP638_002039 [Amoeboaphelidium occidentale]|nr:hypothetical protein MP638_002039 [Amoeboaphelidium occidentale]